MIEQYSLLDGKYIFRLDTDTHTLVCLRYGEPWREFVGDKAIHALFDEVLRLRKEDQHKETLSVRAAAIVAMQTLKEALDK